MTRHLYCRECGEKSIARGLHPEDKAMGYDWRCCYVSAVTPKGYGLTIITDGETKRVELESVICDECGNPIHGEIAVARTMWNTRRESEPDQWETEFGTILDPATVKAADKLSKDHE